MNKLEGQWIEVFKSGDYGARGVWSADDVAKLAASYNPQLHAAPVVVGHPADDSPAFAWVSQLMAGRNNGNASLWAQLEKVAPEFEDAVRAGRFTQRSVALYKNFEPTGGPYLRHLGFLGAAIPRVKGLQPIKFQFGDAEHIEFAVNLEEKPMEGKKDEKNPPTLSQEEVGWLKQFAERVKSLFGGGTSSQPDTDLKQALAKQRQELEASFVENIDKLRKELSEAQKKTSDQLSDAARAQRRSAVEAFVEKLQAQGKWVPAFEKAYGLKSLMCELAESPVVLTFTEKQDGKDVEVKRSALEVLTRFFADQGKVVDFSHIAGKARSAAARKGRLRFTEPRSTEHKEVVGIDTAQKIDALMREARNNGKTLSYTEAYRTVTEEEHEAGAGQEA